jgi:hypothetical protein
VPGRGLRCVFKICFDMADDCLERLRLHADFEHLCKVRRHVIDALEVVNQGAEPIDNVSYNSGYAALIEPLCYVVWPYRFRLATPMLRRIFRSSQVPVALRRCHAGYGGRQTCHGKLVPDDHEGGDS